MHLRKLSNSKILPDDDDLDINPLLRNAVKWSDTL